MKRKRRTFHAPFSARPAPRTPETIEAERLYEVYQRKLRLYPGTDLVVLAYRDYKQARDRCPEPA